MNGPLSLCQHTVYDEPSASTLTWLQPCMSTICLAVRNVPVLTSYCFPIDLTNDFQIHLELDLARFRNTNLAGFEAGYRFGKNLFLDHRTICLMKLMASTMLLLRGSTVQCFLCYVTVCQFLTKFVEWQLILYFFSFV